MEEVVEIFSSFMHGEHSIANCVSKLLKIYQTSDFDQFRKTIEKCACCILLRSSKSRTIAKTSELLIAFLTSPELIRGDCAELNSSNVEIDPLFYTSMRDILHFNESSCRFVRFQCCYLIDKIFDNLPLDTKLDLNFLNDVSDKMRMRLNDISAHVRVKAISVLARMQDLDDDDCPIINEFIKLLDYEINEPARKIVASNICMTNKSLTHIINRVYDTKSSVRVVVYNRLSKTCPVRVLTIEQRVMVVNAGLAETDSDAAAAFRRLAVEAWFTNSCSRDLNLLIDLFDVIADNEFLARFLLYIFNNISISDLEEIVNNFLYDDIFHQIESNFRIENFFIFSNILSFIIKNPGKVSFKLSSCIPEINKICILIEKIIFFNNDIFVLGELFKLLRVYDTADEAGRKIAIDLMVKIFSRPSGLAVEYLREVVKTYVVYATDDISTLDTIVEVVSEIRQPMNPGAILSQGTTQRFDEMTQTSSEKTEILITCLAIIKEVLKDRHLNLTTAPAISLLEFFVLPLVQDERCDVRIEAVICLALFCIYNRNYATKYFVLLSHIAKIDGKEIKNIAISAIFDIYTLYGPTFQIESDEDSYENFIIELLTDNENDVERLLILTAGISKLFLLKRIKSPQIMAFLIKSYLDPTCQASLQIKCVLSQFFNIYLTQKFSEFFDIFIQSCLITIDDFAVNGINSMNSITQLANLFANFTKFELKKATENPNQINLREKLVLALLEALLNNEIESDIPVVIIKKILSTFNVLVATEKGLAQAKEITEKIIEKLTEEKDTKALQWIKKIQDRLAIFNFAEPRSKGESMTNVETQTS